ncbi:hypothetical protein CALVIDRAFT_29000 [Calocera viscosa TUFC12733]|uniref:Uncharacterized protein n=1 Tax=Calocera viscosa (strain TUFC12733) TaxID=1330018 RepID=A0A167PAP2_CALVF|nr:hypothetical protein CALVIDRAFT_29000 [Calocera viscosa TUFC12733]
MRRRSQSQRLRGRMGEQQRARAGGPCWQSDAAMANLVYRSAPFELHARVSSGGRAGACENLDARISRILPVFSPLPAPHSPLSWVPSAGVNYPEFKPRCGHYGNSHVPRSLVGSEQRGRCMQWRYRKEGEQRTWEGAGTTVGPEVIEFRRRPTPACSRARAGCGCPSDPSEGATHTSPMTQISGCLHKAGLLASLPAVSSTASTEVAGSPCRGSPEATVVRSASPARVLYWGAAVVCWRRVRRCVRAWFEPATTDWPG